MTRTRFACALLLIVLVAIGLRVVFPVADPPTQPSVGVVWHDEGAWVHNARNRALFGAWRLDEWNPMYITPVLTGLEYASFRLLGVGLRQARLVSELLGVVSVWLIGLAVARRANRKAGLMAASLLATNFIYVMYDRAATMEATMVALLVISYYGHARASDQPAWGLLAGTAAIAAYFAKASAVFFVAALGLDALLALAPWTRASSAAARRAAAWTLAGLAVAGALALALFVLPNWHEYRFYNWQISVTRKPVYTLKALADRASTLAVNYDFFSQMWPVFAVAVAAVVARASRWRTSPPGQRLLLLWIVLGITELVVHDTQERRLVFLIPPMVALAALALGGGLDLPAAASRRPSPLRALVGAPFLLYACYLVLSALVRVPFLHWIDSGPQASSIVRVSSVLAVVAVAWLYARWSGVTGWLSRQVWPARTAVLVVAIVVAGDLAQFAQWAGERTYKNYDAMVAIGRWLPPGTLVHGKLANGLALENGIKPVFIGNGFGNYQDKFRRDDIRYVVTYLRPFVGYEGRFAIKDLLEAYPDRRVLHTFDVAESEGGNDLAALILKRPE